MFGANRAPILHRHQHFHQMVKNEISHDPCHHGVPTGVSNTFSEAVAYSAQTVHLSCVKISTISKRTESSFHLSLISKEYHRVRPKRFMSRGTFATNSAPILHRHKHYLRTDQNKIPHDPRHLVVPSGACKTISKPVVHLAQTMHLSCVKIRNITKWTESSFHLGLIT
jgi:hypothetical protein